MTDELVIDASNFDQYFRDVRKCRPERDDVMARYSAIAEFIDGMMKRDIIDLLLNKDKAVPATQLLRKIGGAIERDAVRVCKEICQDLASGMTSEEVEKKPYKYTMEFFYYTKKKYVPTDDPHWSIISLNNLDEFLDKSNQKCTIKTRIIEPEEENGGEVV